MDRKLTTEQEQQIALVLELNVGSFIEIDIKAYQLENAKKHLNLLIRVDRDLNYGTLNLEHFHWLHFTSNKYLLVNLGREIVDKPGSGRKASAIEYEIGNKIFSTLKIGERIEFFGKQQGVRIRLNNLCKKFNSEKIYKIRMVDEKLGEAGGYICLRRISRYEDINGVERLYEWNKNL